MSIILLKDILTIFSLSIIVIYVCHRLRIPTIIGFLLTGIFAGPYGLGLVKAIEFIEILAEVGVVMLLFTLAWNFPSRISCTSGKRPSWDPLPRSCSPFWLF